MRKQYNVLLPCLALSLVLLSGCGKEEVAPSRSVPETMQEMITLPPETAELTQAIQTQETTAQIQEETPTFDYKPGTMGVYVMADPNIEAEPSVLDSITMTLSEDITRVRVSNRQFDFVKNGMQVGGFLLVEFPEGILEKAAQSMEDFDAMSDHLVKQTMSEVYPSESRLFGGGHVGRGFYALTVVNKPLGEKLWSQYEHRIYIGENYCYDFWIDTGWWADSGFGIEDSLVADDIKPELNEVEFAWSPDERPRMTPWLWE